MTMNNLETGTPFYCDLYHLTMAQAWFLDGKHEEPKTSEAFFRRCPFNGGYLISVGLGEFLQWAEKWEVKAEDVAYLAALKGATGQPLFKKEFLDYLKGQKLRVNMQAVPEGEIVFPNEPVLSVSGPNWQVDMAEAAFLNIFNAQSLIATKAARIVQAACAERRSASGIGIRFAAGTGYGMLFADQSRLYRRLRRNVQRGGGPVLRYSAERDDGAFLCDEL